MLNLLGLPGYVYGIIFGGIALIILTVLIIILPFKTWCKAMISGAYISFFRLIGMQLRKNKPEMLTEAYITAKRAGIKVTIDELESHYMSGGDVLKVVNALIAAYNAKIPLSIATAKAIDLAGRDVLSAVKFSVTPRVIETPLISAVAKDGIELIIKTRVTVRINIARLIGGAGEDTIIARVGEGIVTTVGSAESHADVLQNPDIISKTVLLKGLDAATAFEILSIDIADINVGKNIGADLKAAQAEADKKIAQAKAEERRAMAIAAEQEMRAKTQEMKAEVLSAESEVPKAMAQAFKKGNIGIMDYYKMQNIVADTSMRKALGQNQDDDNKKPKPGGSNPFGFKFDE